MGYIWRTLQVTLFQLRREILSKRTIVLFLIIGIFIYSNMEPVEFFCAAVGINATPLGFVHMINDFIFQTVFLLGIIFLLSSAPFRGDFYPYIVYRSGDKEWEIGNILYIIIITFLYTVFLVIMSIIGLKGRIDFVCEWGKIWGTLARTNAGSQFGVQFAVSDYIIGKYEALYAMIVSFLLEWTCFIWIGMCIYFFNSLTKKSIGVFLAGIFVFLDTMIYNSWTPWAYRFSPVTLSHLSAFTKGYVYYGITLQYAWRFFGITIIGFIVGTILLTKKVRDYE
jgi:hypothetical protein